MMPVRFKHSLKQTINSCLRYSSTETAKPIQNSLKASKTVDINDVEHHSRFHETWWHPKGPMKALHSMNYLRVPFVRDGLKNIGLKEEMPDLPLNNVKILDIGCGGGILSEPLARLGANVTGLDASSDLISIATNHAALDTKLCKKPNYVHGSLEMWSKGKENTFDAVVGSEIIEHVNDTDLFLKHCIEVLKPGGSLFITTLNKTFTSWVAAIIGAEYILKIIPKGTHQWNKFVPPGEARRILENHGCKVKLIHGMQYNPLKEEWSWCSSTQIHYAVHAIKSSR